MGLLSLRQKIAGTLTQDLRGEADVMYLLVEIGKFLERSGDNKKHLGDAAELRLNPDDYPVIRFFRNWAAHTENDRNQVPPIILEPVARLINGGRQEDAEGEIFEALRQEMSKFAAAIGAQLQFSWADFTCKLKLILAEQPVKFRELHKWIGYDQSLALHEL